MGLTRSFHFAFSGTRKTPFQLADLAIQVYHLLLGRPLEAPMVFQFTQEPLNEVSLVAALPVPIHNMTTKLCDARMHLLFTARRHFRVELWCVPAANLGPFSPDRRKCILKIYEFLAPVTKIKGLAETRTQDSRIKT